MNVAALLQAPVVDVDAIPNELSTNGFIILDHGSHNQTQNGKNPNNVVQLTTQLRAAVDEVWPNRFGSRYKSVKALLASWDADDLGVIKEVEALKHVFADFYRFDVSTYIIPSQYPDRALTRQVMEFVDSAQNDTLLIFYYAGHASMNPNRHDTVIWSANRQRSSPALRSNGIQSLLEAVNCDTLLLYDCCHSADTAIAPAHSSRAATELIAACGFEGVAPEVGEHSFTNALIEVLILSASKGPFLISQLHRMVIQRLKNWEPSPIRDETGKFVLDPHGRLVMEPQRRRTPVYCNLTQDSSRKPIMLACIPQAPRTGSLAPPPSCGPSFIGKTLSIATTSSLAPVPNQGAPSKESMSRNPDIIMTIKMVDEVVAGQHPNVDALVEWMRSAPREIDQIGISLAENSFVHAEDSQDELLPCRSQQEEPQTGRAWNTTFLLTEEIVASDDGRYNSPNLSVSQWLDSLLYPQPSVQSISGESGTKKADVYSSYRRGPWSQNEDAYLVKLVHTQGAPNWVRIAQLIGSRCPKQCRERYHQNLKPTLNHEPISPAEGIQIERLVGEMGKRWAEIAQRLHGRSDNAVKNWWNESMNRRRRLVVRRRTSDQHPAAFDQQVQPSWSAASTNGSVRVEG